MAEEFIKFENVSFRYENAEDEPELPLALKNVNLTVNKGELVAVLGHNGSGKSTLAKLTNAILVPESGKVSVMGMDTSDENLKYDIRRKVGMVFQNPDNQIVATIVEDDVAFGPENLGVHPDEIRKRVDESLRAVEMYEMRLAEPHNLSGGQKQRVAIAGILAMQTDGIVFDEPTAMLDPRGRQAVMDTILKINKEQGKTVMFITHFMDEAVQADRVVVINNGEIMTDGTPKEVFSDVDKLRKVGLDVPQARELQCRLEQNGIKLNGNILFEDECIKAIKELF
ncbi:MAG: energy-coupling factor transporter ATPase [Ruminococcaceae bacterium]|nr:energy-coupling factor transporter ATPase [Oscillospiraceae bacterium]